MKLGFIGLGAMGAAMARRLMDAGHELWVYNRTASKAEPLVQAGAHRVDSPAQVGRRAPIVFSMLFDDQAVETTVFGENGLAEGLPKDGLHVCCSTLSLEQARRLDEEHKRRGQRYLSQTVLGRPPAAASGELFIILAGAPKDRDAIKPLSSVFGQRLFEVGDDPAHANLVKLCLNSLIFSTIEQMAEVFSLCEKGGVAPGKMFEVMTNSFYSAPVHKNYGKVMLEKNYDSGQAPMAIGLKDNDLYLAAGKALRVPLPISSLLHDRFVQALAAGGDNLDFAAIYQQVREDGGLK